MNEEMKEGLSEGGIDLDDIFGRLPGSAELIKKLLKKFPQEKCYNKLKQSMDAGDYKEAFVHAHDLKGLVANLSMKPLYEKTNLLVESLRAGNYEEAKKLMCDVEAAYDRVIAAIAGYL